MGINKANRADAEIKRNYEISNFIGGMNTKDADDSVKDSDFRLIQNGEIDNKGIIRSRRGSRRLRGLESILERSLGKGLPKDIQFFKVINDDGNLMESALFDPDKIQEIQDMNPPYNIKFVCIHREVGINTDYVFYFDYFNIDIKSDKIEVFRESNLYPTEDITDIDYNIQVTEFANSLVFSIDKGVMFKFDLQNYVDTTKTDEPTYTEAPLVIQSPKMTWYRTGATDALYPVYKPTPLEIRKIGFNVVTGSPLSYINKQGITEKTIQGLYVTDTNGIPLMSLPLGNLIRLNIMYTGTIAAFDIKFKDGDIELKVTAALNSSLSVDGLKVYDLTLKDVSPLELEIAISITGDTSVGTYRDFYPVGKDDQLGKPIVALDISQYDSIEIKGRMCYYKDLILWFSEIHKFDYVPNYNYIPLSLPYADKIVKIVYFRDNYIIFSNLRIYKMSGTFGNSDFRIEVINDAIGCIDANSVRYLDNYLIFMTHRGLYKLKSDRYQADYENVGKIDEQIDGLIDKNSAQDTAAFLYLNKYVYFIGNKTVKYYNDLGAYTVDESNFFPHNVRQYKGLLYFTSNDVAGDRTKLFLYDAPDYFQDDVVEDYEEYELKLNTTATNMKNPLNDKKVKNVYLKVEHGKNITPVRVALVGDGYTLFDPVNFKASINAQGEVEYNPIVTNSFVLDTNDPLLGDIVLGNTKLGGTNITVHKLNYPCRIKNVALEIAIKANSSFALYVMGYVYKLKKVRGE